MCQKSAFYRVTSVAYCREVEETQPLIALLGTPYLQGVAAVVTFILKLVHRAPSQHTLIQPPAQLLRASCNHSVLLMAKDFGFPGPFCF